MRGDPFFLPSLARGNPTGWPRFPPGLLILAGFLLLWIYAYRISENPLSWEEPRRCLIAMEMIERHDYIVPHLLGETYYNKPPLQNWLLVFFSGNRLDRVGPGPLRLISLLSLAGIASLLWALGRRKEAWSPAWAPPLVFLTLGIVVQYGRSGEVDPLFAFWIALAFWCFETGRRTRSSWLQWGLSQALLAPGILTKIIAPIFFYPPVLVLALKDRGRFPFSLPAFLAGLAGEIVLVCAWLIPYSADSSVSSFLLHGWTEEILPRTPLGADLVAFLKHFASFPFEFLGNILPWSLMGVLWLYPQMRRATILQTVRKDPLLELSWTVSAWILLLFWFMPGGKGRYLLPAYPFLAVLIADALGMWASSTHGRRVARRRTVHGFFQRALVDRSTGWIFLVLLWAGGVSLAGIYGTGGLPIQPLVIGSLALMAASFWIRRISSGRIFLLMLGLGLLYGIAYSGMTLVQRAQKEELLLQPARKIAEAILKPLPLVCGKEVTRGSCYVFARHLGRVPKKSHPSQGAYYLVSSLSEGAKIHGTPIAQAPPLGLWQVEQK